MVTEAWKPSVEDKQLACEGYVNFAGGVAILNDPEATTAIHAQEVVERNFPEIIHAAESLMHYGLVEVIKKANEPKFRNNLMGLEHRFHDALPHMLATLDRSYDEYQDRLQALNPFFGTLRPAPMLDQHIYNNLCHRRLQRVRIARLILPFRPSPILENSLRRRTLSKVPV
jgi:hypothetical protein